MTRKNGYPNIDNICNRTNEIQPIIQDVVKINVIHDDEYDEDRQENTPILVNEPESARAALEIQTGNTVISVNNNDGNINIRYSHHTIFLLKTISRNNAVIKGII